MHSANLQLRRSRPVDMQGDPCCTQQTFARTDRGCSSGTMLSPSLAAHRHRFASLPSHPIDAGPAGLSAERSLHVRPSPPTISAGDVPETRTETIFLLHERHTMLSESHHGRPIRAHFPFVQLALSLRTMGSKLMRTGFFFLHCVSVASESPLCSSRTIFSIRNRAS